MTDALDSMPDDVLGETLAVEVLNWRRHRGEGVFWCDAMHENAGSFTVRATDKELVFAKSVDAVLPILERYVFRIDRLRKPDAYCVYIERESKAGGWTYVKAEDAKLARAVCMVLIKEARAQKGGA